MLIAALIFVAVISIIAVVLTLRDKNAARKNAWRVKERTLLAIAALGGYAAHNARRSPQNATREVHDRHTADNACSNRNRRIRVQSKFDCQLLHRGNR